MIKLSKFKDDDHNILVFDVRPRSITRSLGRESKVFLGTIIPPHRSDGPYRWHSRWGFNRGETYLGLEIAQECIVVCARGMYK